jgi:AIG2-like family
MAESKVNVFFYGSFINRAVLAEVKLIPDQVEVAQLWGFDISIRPLANLVRSDQHSVYGIICQATHAELDRLYGQHWVGTYLPEAVLVETNGGRLKPALCYIAPSPPSAPAADDYLDRIVGPAREYGFPAWYITRLESFRQRSRSGDERPGPPN